MINDCILNLLLKDVLLEEAFLLFKEFYCFLEILHPDEDGDYQVDELQIQRLTLFFHQLEKD